MKTIRYDDYIFFDKKSVGSVRKLVRAYGLKYNSYAGEVVRRVFHYFFGDATRLLKEYKKYYKKEYDNLDMFLECHMGIPEGVRSRFVGHNIFYVNLEDKGDRIGEAFNDKELQQKFWDMVGGIEREDSNGIRYEQFFN